ncbi:uncharacterized protein BX664DRAFT_341993 [Halteromyces radiatus]|uniref:uncharacterized protein n=1 Tax=Halteromyces radiatus TaxID=101107 RepID=UPI002220B5C4|nr:uncharacterized protein BX664DRAFT_341993 [Halteromyces radiatus]KAI8079985.1 hypothetical protein BX664DRAFT_341993 [Halteromyces radiatus]
MNVVKEIQRINQRELQSAEGWSDTGSWHAQYKDTAWIFVANLDYELTEGDVVCIFSQYGEPVNIEMARDKKTGKSMGFAFLQYEDQRSSILAVDNLNGSKVLSRTLRVDHSYGPKSKKPKEGEDEDNYLTPKYNVAPPMLEVTNEDTEKIQEKEPVMDEEDPMAQYFRDKKKKKEEKKHKKHKKNKEERNDQGSSRHHKSSHKSSSRKRHYDDKYDRDSDDDRKRVSYGEDKGRYRSKYDDDQDR